MLQHIIKICQTQEKHGFSQHLRHGSAKYYNQRWSIQYAAFYILYLYIFFFYFYSRMIDEHCTFFSAKT